mmetsp:Transcript_59250/g.117693  ORF Transcript_59250/g.117693 Transcript_59250/m.117693 type:complete len:89 (+) Transcript_59250:528-794(+)
MPQVMAMSPSRISFRALSMRCLTLCHPVRLPCRVHISLYIWTGSELGRDQAARGEESLVKNIDEKIFVDTKTRPTPTHTRFVFLYTGT